VSTIKANQQKSIPCYPTILLSELKVKMLLCFKYNYFLKRKTAINVFFGSYRKGKYRTFNIETEPSYAETHPKTPTPT
jgi:hypothetical protein